MNAKRSFKSRLGALCALALATPTLAQEPAAPPAAQAAGPLLVTVAGRVLDAAGAPAPGARLSSFWSFDEADPAGRPSQRIVADAEGVFRGELQLAAPGPFALLAYSADGSQAGLVQLASDADKASILLPLAPALRVHARIASQGLDHPVRWANTFWTLAGSGLTLACAASTRAELELVLPPGRYTWFAYGEEVQSKTGAVTLAADQREHDLGTIEIAPTFLALNRGKELPAWHVSEARGVPLEQATLASFRGRWLLVAFFAANSGPAVLVELPQMIKFHEDTRGTPRAARFELVAFHDGSLPDLAALDRVLAPLREQVWGGRTIPFPLLIDATNATFDAYGIESLPTLVLVDPDGKLVGEATLAQLVAELDREAAPEGELEQGPPREGR